MAAKRNGHDLLTEIRTAQENMQTDISYVKDKIDSLYRLEPPGLLVQLTTHLEDHKNAKWRDRTMLTLFAGAAGTVASYIINLFRK